MENQTDKKKMPAETIESFVKLSTLFSQYFLAKQFNEELEEFSKLEWYIINFLETEKNITQDHLMRIIPADNIAVRRAIRRLGRSKHIMLVQDETSQESTLGLTKKGEQLSAKLTEIDNNIAKEMMRNISENQRVEFEECISGVLKSITP